MSTPSYPHLSTKGLELVEATNDVRISAIQAGAWIAYPRAKEIMARMERLFRYPRTTRMPNMLVVGPSNNGKSTILERFVAQHPPDTNPEGNATIVPVVMVEAPSRPDVNEFYARILSKLFVPYRSSANTAERCHQVKQLFETLKVKLLIIDEIQHLIAGSTTKQRDFRNAIKSLGNETKVSIVAAGVEEAFNAFSSDPQLSNRFVPAPLPRWQIDTDFGSVLRTLEGRMPLRKPSALHDTAMAHKIMQLAEGTLGDTCDLLKIAAERAIQDGEERITLKLLEALPWVPPSKRKGSIALL